MSWEAGNGIKQYLDKVPSQHRIRPKFMAMLAAYLEKLQDVYTLLMQMDEAFDLDKAIGAQLDILGQVVGTGRLLSFNPHYAESLLEDEYFRRVVKAKISMNQWDGRYESLLELWAEVFPGETIKLADHQDMSIVVRFFEMYDLFEAELITRGYYAPKPEGVRVNFEFHTSSEVEGQLYHAGAITKEAVKELLHIFDFGGADTHITGQLHHGGALTEQIRESLAAPAYPKEMAVNSHLFLGGGVAAEYITQYLKEDSNGIDTA